VPSFCHVFGDLIEAEEILKKEFEFTRAQYKALQKH